MANAHLATYLNDHLAGTVAAIQLLGHLAAAHAGTALEPVLVEVRAEVAADREELERLMARLKIAESRPRQATAWLAEKATQLKLLLDDPSGGPLRLLEGLEAVAIGIEGKQALWRALATVAADVDELQEVDYERLQQRGQDQRQRVEVMRLEAAKAALADAS
jgi:hypothetical protein